jgi:nucleotide-binding universal stress UspA family protein
MSKLHTLVFGDDGSPTADIAWLFVNSHVWSGWRVEIVTAQWPELGVPIPPKDSILHPWDPPQRRKAFGEAGFAEVEHLTANGDARLVLLRDSELLVIGPRGPGLLKSLHLGSTADWLLNNSVAPLLIARHGRQIRNVVLCTDGSKHADRVTNVLASLPWVQEVQVTVLAVDDGRIDVDQACKTATKILEAAGAKVSVAIPIDDSDTLLSRIHVSSPTELIKRHLDETEPDLVALGTRGLSGLQKLRVGSTASAIAQTASCSVLVASVQDETETA